MRDGNPQFFFHFPPPSAVVSLPMRDGNPVSPQERFAHTALLAYL